MSNKELNSLLLNKVPEIKEEFEKETSWQEGLETGSHVVFQYVLVPFSISALEKEQDDVIKRIFDFINNIIKTGGNFEKEVVQLSFLEPLKSDYSDIYDFSKVMLPETLKLFNEIEF